MSNRLLQKRMRRKFGAKFALNRYCPEINAVGVAVLAAILSGELA